MLVKTEGIVIHQFKIADNKAIIVVFTKQYGKLSFIHYFTSSNRRVLNITSHPFSIVELDFVLEKKKELHKIKEIVASYHFSNIHLNFLKQAIVCFLAEILNIILIQPEPNEVLYSFVKEKIIKLDKISGGFENFHLTFLTQLLHFLGIYPENNYSENCPIFDLKASRFANLLSQNSSYIPAQTSKIIHELLSTAEDEEYISKIYSTDRNLVIDTLIKYLSLHLEHPVESKTLPILRDLLSEVK